jgi:hypothetical protein
VRFFGLFVGFCGGMGSNGNLYQYRLLPFPSCGGGFLYFQKGKMEIRQNLM